jgi:ATP-dependent DNA helicase RecQ
VDPQQVLQQVFGYRAFRGPQEAIVRHVLAGGSGLVLMPTGGGKSLCYQVPALCLPGLTLVVSPLIALMQDQVAALQQAGVAAAALHSALDGDQASAIWSQLQQRSLKLLYVSPERLLAGDLLERLGPQVSLFAIDEAHCLSQWGHDFRPEYRQLALLRDRFPAASIHAFTATATPRVRDDIARQLALRDPATLIGTFDRPNLVYRVVPRADRVAQVLKILGRHRGEASIVYCISRKETERLAARLAAEGLLARPYHAGLDARQRHATQEAFASETIDVVVATVAFGMGIDRSDVRLVLHTSLPKSLEAYQQETGRAGRDGLAAECVLLYSSADVFSWESLVRKSAAESELDAEEQEKLCAGQVEHLHAMRRYAQAARCRHAALSEYFGQAYPATSCGACDVCLGETNSLPDATVTAQKILSCVARVGERFGVRHVCEVLRGAKTEAVARYGHDRLSTFGLLASLEQRTAENLVHQLLDQELLSRTPGDRPVVTLNPRSWEVLRGTREVVLLEPRAGKARTTQADADDWQGVDRDLFERLRKWRRRVAEARGKPAWTILDDKALRVIARDKPSSPAALLRCKGIGDKRLADFGTAILDIVSGKEPA